MKCFHCGTLKGILELVMLNDENDTRLCLDCYEKLVEEKSKISRYALKFFLK